MRARITLDFDFDQSMARQRLPDVDVGHPHEPVDGIGIYVDSLAQELREYLTERLDDKIDVSPVHFIGQLNPPQDDTF